MRISYSCTASIERIIKAHIQKVLNQQNQNESQCKCAGSFKYPLKGGNCRSMNIVYKATINSEHETKLYIGLCSTHFRYANQKKYFKCGIYKNDTQISKYVCSLKRKKQSK